MERGRILILGQTKENTYEIRNLLYSKRFELDIALSKNVGKLILSQRQMNLLILHTEAIDAETQEFFEFLEERRIEIPVVLFGFSYALSEEETHPSPGMISLLRLLTRT
jgi:hypothetical protein